MANNSRVIRGIGIVPTGGGDDGGHNHSHKRSPNPEALANNESNQNNQGDTGNNSSLKDIESNTSSPESPEILDDENTGYESSTGSVTSTQTQTQQEAVEHNQLEEGGYKKPKTGYGSSPIASNSSDTQSHSFKPGDRVIHNESWVGTIKNIHPDGKVAQVYLDLMESLHPVEVNHLKLLDE